MNVLGRVRQGALIALILATACSSPQAPPTVQTFQIPMRDGILLATDVYLPAGTGGRHPVILLRTPYNKAWLGDYGRYFASHGFAFAIQDVRGRFESEGTWEPFLNEGRDGYDAIEWLADQDWSTGKVGMMGGSYSGSAQFAAAVMRPPHLVTIVPSVTPAIPFDNLPYERGVLLLGWSIRWTDIMENARSGREFAAKLEAAVREDWSGRLDRLPVVELDTDIVGRQTPYWRQWIEHSSLDSYWAPVTYLDQLTELDIPVLLQSGWFDGGTRGAKLAYRRLVEGGNPEIRMIVGPWAHSDRGGRYLNGADMGPEADVDLFERYRSWFDRWLKEESAPLPEASRVELYLMGTNRWLRGNTYPLPETTITPFYLSEPSNTSSVRINGSLVRSDPPIAEGYDEYAYDPGDPTPSFHASMKRNALDAYHSRVMTHDDVLLYETPPFAHPVGLAGPVDATLFASSTARDTDWVATLYAVSPEGRPYPIGLTFGVLRARFRESLSAPTLLDPGTVYEYDIDLGHTAVTIPAGHRLRLEIASAAFPEYSRNLNTGENNERTTRYIVARQSVHRGGRFASRLNLPVLRLDDE